MTAPAPTARAVGRRPLRTVDDFTSPTREALLADGELKTARLHPSTQAFMRRVAHYGGLTDRVSVAYARRRLRTMMPLVATRPGVASVTDRMLSGPHGSIPVRIVTPQTGVRPRPALVWFAGGGFVLGDLVTAEPTARSLANRLGAVVVCVDYRKAPEHPINDAYDDALAALRWTFDNAEHLDIDDRAVCVGGDSAGGNVATVAAREFRSDAGGRGSLALQVLVYPAVSTPSEPARSRNTAGSLLNDDAVRWFETQIAGSVEPDSARHAPLTVDDLSACPPAVVVTAGFDPLRDEGLAYVDRLREAGVAVDHLHYPDEIHGFFPMDLVLHHAADAMDAVAASVRLRLGIPPSPTGREPTTVVQLMGRAVARRLGATRAITNYAVEQVEHTQIRTQRWLVQACGLSSGRDIEALAQQVKRLENEIRLLRRSATEPPRAG